MNIRYIKSFCILALGAFLASCSVEEFEQDTLQEGAELTPVTDDVVSGELLVRFDERVSRILEESGVVTRSGVSAASRSGVLTVDQILDMVQGYQIERVFPVDIRTEDKARAEGLHLWYIVRFSEDFPVSEVASKLSALGEVSRVAYNKTLKRNGGKAVPLSADQVRNLTLSGGAFNDPLLKYQWNLINNGSSQQVPVQKPNVSQAGFMLGADVNVKTAWDKCKGHPSIIVAVLDEGIDINHPDLKSSMWVNEDEE